MIVSLISIATMFVAGWLTFIYFVMRHPGYVWRAAGAAVVCLGAATLVAGRPAAALRIPIGVWGAALAAFGVWALVAPGDDGWVTIAAALFVVEGLLALTSAIRRLEAR